MNLNQCHDWWHWCDNIRKVVIGQDDDCTTGCLLNYSYFKKYNKLIAINLSKQRKLKSRSRW